MKRSKQVPEHISHWAKDIDAGFPDFDMEKLAGWIKDYHEKCHAAAQTTAAEIIHALQTELEWRVGRNCLFLGERRHRKLTWFNGDIPFSITLSAADLKKCLDSELGELEGEADQESYDDLLSQIDTMKATLDEVRPRVEAARRRVQQRRSR